MNENLLYIVRRLITTITELLVCSWTSESLFSAFFSIALPLAINYSSLNSSHRSQTSKKIKNTLYYKTSLNYCFSWINLSAKSTVSKKNGALSSYSLIWITSLFNNFLLIIIKTMNGFYLLFMNLHTTSLMISSFLVFFTMRNFVLCLLVFFFGGAFYINCNASKKSLFDVSFPTTGFLIDKLTRLITIGLPSLFSSITADFWSHVPQFGWLFYFVLYSVGQCPTICIESSARNAPDKPGSDQILIEPSLGR